MAAQFSARRRNLHFLVAAGVYTKECETSWPPTAIAHKNKRPYLPLSGRGFVRARRQTSLLKMRSAPYRSPDNLDKSVRNQKQKPHAVQL